MSPTRESGDHRNTPPRTSVSRRHGIDNNGEARLTGRRCERQVPAATESENLGATELSEGSGHREARSAGRFRGRRTARVAHPPTTSNEVHQHERLNSKGARGYRVLPAEQASLEHRETPSASLGENRSYAEDIPEYAYVTSFDGAKVAALKARKWLLMCVVKRHDPATQSLNNEILRASVVRETLLQHCIFVQFIADQPEGVRTIAYYQFDYFPSMTMIDPRHGEELHKFSGHLVNLQAFLDEHIAHENLDLTSQKQQKLLPPFGRKDLLLVFAFLTTNPNFEVRDDFVHHTMNPDRADDDSDPEQNSSSFARKRHHTGSPSYSPKREKFEDGDEARLSDEAGALSMTDKDEWKNMVIHGGSPCVVRFRLPFGESSRTQTIDVTLDTKLFALFSFIHGQGLLPSRHTFVLSFPRREYSIQHSNMTLGELGFTKTEMVHVDHVPNGSDVSAGSSGVFKK